jgi:hypothetical protein
MLHSTLQVFHHCLLPNHFFNPPLSIDIKGIIIQPFNLSLALHAFPLFTVIIIVQNLGKSSWILQRRCKFRVLALDLRPHRGVAKDLQAYELRVLLWPCALLCWTLLGLGTLRLARDTSIASRIPHVHRQHLSVNDF